MNSNSPSSTQLVAYLWEDVGGVNVGKVIMVEKYVMRGREKMEGKNEKRNMSLK